MKIFRLLPLLSSLLIYSCANQIAPGGGDLDRTPPEVISVIPENGTINFNEDYIEFTFSEYVDKRSVQDAFFISPALEGSPELDWSGKSVRFKFPEELQPDLTYVVTLGTDIVDLNNRNRMAAPFQFTFSTGSTIDKGIVSGKIFDEKPLGIMLFAYTVGDSVINPSLAKPKYISQAGADGTYSILGMADGTYRIFAVGDEYQDLIYNVGQDLFGVPYTDVSLNTTDTSFSNLNFFLSKQDTASPRIQSASMTDRYHILMEFSEKYDSSIIRLDNFYLYDSTADRRINPKYIFHGKTKENELVLVTTEILNQENNIKLFANKITDPAGNQYNNESVTLVVSDKPDTSAADIYSAKEITDRNFLFQFTDAFDSMSAKKGINITDRGNNIIPSEVHFLDDASFVVRPLQPIKQRENYFINVNLLNIVDAAGNKIDSVYKHRFSAQSQLDFSGISGKVVVTGNPNNIKVVLKSAEKGKEYQKNASNNLSFNFDKVNPGKYLLWSYIDKDSSNTYTHGLPFPFKESERFTFYPDTLNLRARWPVGDVVIEYK